ncbi:Nif3-like dinuclear metal center hexameric protein [Candidatus Acetothermia bacterium]|nr:Nif3-like dinuclear metal center hexameric protein [Candidatus Acetothermia bacterium]MBI3459966.1 Nif3-like dinuclear metal center hexameric protein [Candidatus Acetothermia bacterium]
MKLALMIEKLNQIAPPRLALPGDPVGLQVGDPAHDVRKALLALDLTAAVLERAVAEKVNLIVCHHPLLFKPVQAVTSDTALGKKLYTLIKCRIDFFAMHTNFDVAPRGLNDALAEFIGLEETKPLQITQREVLYKLAVFVPESHEQVVRLAMHEAGAGVIGEYTHCSFRTPGIGAFKPSESAKPFTGNVEKLEDVKELRVEVLVPERYKDAVVEAMKKAHPYEEVAYDLYELSNEGLSYGIGRVGDLETPATVEVIVEKMKKSLGMTAKDYVRLRGSTQKKIKRVAICSGSGGSLLAEVLNSSAELFITGEIKYHEELSAGESGLIVAAFGHDHTEKIFGVILKERLESEFAGVEKDDVEFILA